MDLRDIKAIIDLMKKNSIQEFEMERQDFKIRLRRSSGGGPGGGDEVAYAVPAAAPVMAAVVPPALPSGTAPTPGNDLEIKSPMIGTFYRSPSPEAGSYVEVGSEVGPDTVVCIIEAMKVMNEIKAETRGVVTQILVDNAKPVEFGQPLFKLRPV